jgi:hypothetical protein
MSVTTTGLSRTAGLCAAASGLLYVLVQFVHPAETVAAVAGTAWAVTGVLTLVMAVLGAVGVTGIYLRQVREAGVLGLVGYVLFTAFYLVAVAFTFVEVFVLPELTRDAPHLVEDLLGIFSGGDTGSLGAVTAVGTVAFALYLLGGSALGIAIFRAQVLARWAGALLAAGAALTLAVPLVPHSLARLAAVPVGVAMARLGLSLWRRQPDPAAVAADTGRARPEHTALR